MARHRQHEALEVFSLGGLGEIGMNCTLIRYGQQMVMIDCGLMFPEHDLLGLELIMPDVRRLDSIDATLVGIIFTHGHEDHIGAYSFVAELMPRVPVFAPPFAKELLAHRLRERGHGKIEIHLFPSSRRWELGPFKFEAIPVAHSIPDAFALAIETPVGKILHTGDFKIDPTPPDGWKTDVDRLRQLGDDGVLLLLSDSTNVEASHEAGSEASVRPGLMELINQAAGKVFVTLFSSNIRRVEQVISCARAAKRSVYLAGRSVGNYVSIAQKLGLLSRSASAFLSEDELMSVPDRHLLCIASGSQGEFGSTMRRLAFREHRSIAISPGDRVVFSSRTIPGNEQTVNLLINEFYRQGAAVFTPDVADIHVSGHASIEQQREMIRLVRPTYFVPIHGEYRHLAQHRAAAIAEGVEASNAHIILDGDTWKYANDDVTIIPGERPNRLFVDGQSMGDLDGPTIKARKRMARGGLVMVGVTIDRRRAAVRGEPRLSFFGLEPQVENGWMAAAQVEVAQVIHEIGRLDRPDEQRLELALVAAMRRIMKRDFDKRPVIIPWITVI